MPRAVKQSNKRKRATSKPSGGIESQIESIDVVGPCRFALYGMSGTGKTTLAATFPKPILWILASGCMKPGELRSINTPHNRKVIDKLNLEHSSQIGEVVAYQKKTGKYATIVQDHITGLQDLILKEVLGIDELPAQGSWGMAERGDWQIVTEQMKGRMSSIMNLDVNTVLIAQERVFNTDNEGEILIPYVGPATTPSVAGWVNYASDYVCQCFKRQKLETRTKTNKKTGKSRTTQVPVDGVDYCLRAEAHETYQTKFRVPMDYKQPSVVVDPTYDKLMAIINGE
jgi:hypothetical protein